MGNGVGGSRRQVEEGLYRIAQEALNNALKHAHARSVAVTLGQSEGSSYVLEIADDGLGFDPEAIARGRRLWLARHGGTRGPAGRDADRAEPARAGTTIRVEVCP